MNKLNVLEAKESSDVFTRNIKPKTSRENVQARFDREWLLNPAQFNPERNIREKVRIERLLNFTGKHLDICNMRIADLGCGYGMLSKQFRDRGAHIDAVDISKIALSHVKNEKGIHPVQAFIPHTHLNDNEYDLVVCTDLIGCISSREHRLLMNEIARLVKKEGFILFSTSIDIDSHDALEKLIALIQTEFEVQHYSLSCHSKFIRIKKIFSAPEKFSQASANPRIKAKELEKKSSIWTFWFRIHSSKMLGSIWTMITPLTNLIVNYLNRSRRLLLFLEKISFSNACISHIAILASRRPIDSPHKKR